jgi:hypothetical protein
MHREEHPLAGQHDLSANGNAHLIPFLSSVVAFFLKLLVERFTNAGNERPMLLRQVHQAN